MAQLIRFTSELYINCGNKLAIETESNSICVELEKLLPAQETDGDSKTPTDIPHESICCLSVSENGNFLAAAGTNKTTTTWTRQDAKWVTLGSITANKRPVRLSFNNDSTHLLVGDKSGDIYEYALSNLNDGRLLLGHTSMLLDLLVTRDGRHLISCDRDEKIRVSRYPDAFDIVAFCLGHTEFVSTLCEFENGGLISGSGDGTIRVWKYESGQESGQYKFTGEKSTVTKCVSFGDKIAVLLSDVNSIHLLQLAENEGKVDIKPTNVLTFDTGFLDLCISMNGVLWALQKSETEPLMLCPQFKASHVEDTVLCDRVNKHLILDKVQVTRDDAWAQLFKQDFDNVGKYFEKKAERIKATEEKKRKCTSVIKALSDKKIKIDDPLVITID